MLHGKSKADLINRLLRTAADSEDDVDENDDDFNYYDDVVIFIINKKDRFETCFKKALRTNSAIRLVQRCNKWLKLIIFFKN